MDENLSKAFRQADKEMRRYLIDLDVIQDHNARKAWLVHRALNIDSSSIFIGIMDSSVTAKELGVISIMLVFNTKEQAEEWAGEKSNIDEITLGSKIL